MNTIAKAIEKQIGIDTSTKQPAWAAAMAAVQYSKNHIGLYTGAQQDHGGRILDYVTSIFPHHRVYLTYRQNFIAVKVEGVTLQEAATTHAHLLSDLCDVSGVSIVARGSNVIFRIAREK